MASVGGAEFGDDAYWVDYRWPENTTSGLLRTCDRRRLASTTAVCLPGSRLYGQMAQQTRIYRTRLIKVRAMKDLTFSELTIPSVKADPVLLLLSYHHDINSLPLPRMPNQHREPIIRQRILNNRPPDEQSGFVLAGCSFTSHLPHRSLTIALCYAKLRDHYAVTFADHQLNGPVRRIVWVSVVHKS